MKNSLSQSARFLVVNLRSSKTLCLLEVKYRFSSLGTRQPKEIPCDISSQNDTLCVYNSLLMKFYVGLDGNVKPLVLFLKYLLRKYDLYGANNFTTSVIFWLVVFLMQKCGQLPSVKEVSEAARVKKFVSGLDCSVPEDYSRFPRKNLQPKGEFLWFKTFLKTYRDYDFSKFLISPYWGYEFSVKIDPSGDMAEAAMYIEAPFKRTRNFSRRIPMDIVNRFRKVCGSLYEILQAYEGPGFANSMLQLFPTEMTEDGELKKTGPWTHPEEYDPYLYN